MPFAIYAIRHLTTGGAYFGSSRNEARRRAVHLWALRKGCHHSAPLQAAWNADGESAFAFEIIETAATEGDMLRRERFWIKDDSAVFNVKKYSMRIRFSPNQRAAENKIRWSDPDFKARTGAAISAAQRARKRTPHSLETRIKIGASQKGRDIGVKRSVETRAKMSASRLGKKRGPYKPETKPRRTLKYLSSLINSSHSPLKN